jgi:hypothetical protein
MDFLIKISAAEEQLDSPTAILLAYSLLEKSKSKSTE